MRHRALLAAALALAAIPHAGHAGPHVRIATEGAYLPWNGTDASGKLIGFEVELAADLCRRIGATCEIVTQEWSGMIPGLIAGRYDVIMAGMSITDERKQLIDFAGPYATAPTAFAAMSGSRLLNVLPSGSPVDMAEVDAGEGRAIGAMSEALRGSMVGVQAGTVQAAMLMALFPRVVVRAYATAGDMLPDLIAGNLSAVVADRATLDGIAKTDPRIRIFGPNFSRGLLGEGIGAGVRKGDTDLKEQLESAITSATEDGTVARLSRQWFGYDVGLRGAKVQADVDHGAQRAGYGAQILAACFGIAALRRRFRGKMSGAGATA